MSATDYLVPEPDPSLDTQPYWEGLKQRVFRVQKCANCGKRRHYPRPVCDACHSMQFDWVPVALHGKVHSWTVCHHAFLPAFRDELPYVLAIADIDGDIRVNLQLEGPPGQPLTIGDEVRVEFRDVNDRLTLPVLVRQTSDAQL